MMRLMIENGGRYRKARPVADGWRKSRVFGRWFRLSAAVNPLGDTEYTSENRA